jgi:hypothetical protein
MRYSAWIGLVLGLMVADARAAPQTIVSPETRVNLMELYTSEGCDSCPPAEEWLSGFTDDRRLWKQLVPMAFHVDYWDDQGWKDPFDSRAYTLRQQQISAKAGTRTIYTPEFVLNGSEWQNWFNHWPLNLPDPSKPGVLSLSADGHRVRLHFVPSVRMADRLEAHVVLLAFGVEVHVGAGENAGAVLSHDFLVLSYTHGMLAAKEDGYDAVMVLAASAVKAPRYALAGWVSKSGDPEPLQAAGGWIAAP